MGIIVYNLRRTSEVAMKSGTKVLVAVLLAGASSLAMADGARAAPREAEDTQAKLKVLQQQIDDLNAQIADLKRSTSDQYADQQNEKTTAGKVKIDNGRPPISSADGKFTASVRGLGPQ